MCICLNCDLINDCKQYFFIQKIHHEFIINYYPHFTPNQSLINVHYQIYNDKFFIEWDLEECLSFKEKPGKWMNFNNLLLDSSK
jgi:hypothetical protein